MNKPAWTPGPWRWEVNAHSKVIQLCGGARPYDETVMAFSRWGMSGATPLFLGQTAGRNYKTLERAVSFAVTVPGREHHSSWFADIAQPDARLIAAAPELYEALKAVLSIGLDEGQSVGGDFGHMVETGAMRRADKVNSQIRAALAKVRGA